MGSFNFIGQYDYLMDDKHRLNIPSKFRKQFLPEDDDRLILVFGVDRCVDAYPFSLWKRELEAMNRLDMNKPENRQFVRVVGASAAEAALDKQGRIIIPLHLRDYAKLEKDVRIVGVFDKIELWNPSDFETFTGEPVQDLSALAEKLSQKNA